MYRESCNPQIGHLEQSKHLGESQRNMNRLRQIWYIFCLCTILRGVTDHKRNNITALSVQDIFFI